MAKNIVAIIGQRKVGRTEAVEGIQHMLPQYAIISPTYYAIQDFCFTAEISLEDFFHRPKFDENINLMFSFKEHQEQKQTDKYLQIFRNELDSTDNVVIDDIYTFKELEVVFKLNAKIILIEAKQEKRKEFGYVDSMDRAFYTQEVTAIRANDVRDWKNTVVVPNDSNIANFRFLLRSQL